VQAVTKRRTRYFGAVDCGVHTATTSTGLGKSVGAFVARIVVAVVTGANVCVIVPESRVVSRIFDHARHRSSGLHGHFVGLCSGCGGTRVGFASPGFLAQLLAEETAQQLGAEGFRCFEPLSGRAHGDGLLGS